MILNLNHLHGKSAGTTARDVVDTLYKLLEEGQIEQNQFATLRIQLEWIQYKQNFRDVVSIAQCANDRGELQPVMDIHIDTRQATPDCLREALLLGMQRANPATPAEIRDQDRLPLEDFRSLRRSIVWEFNKLYWVRLKDWESATGKGYEEALPGGQSDGHRADAIADSVDEFWKLLHELESKNQLPPEVFLLELGVGTGIRCGLWLTRFREVDQERGTNYYPKLRMLLG